MLPGVGHFRATQLLQLGGFEAGLQAVREAVAKGAPFLRDLCWVASDGCMRGRQRLRRLAGLGHFAGPCERFPAAEFGWGGVEVTACGVELVGGCAGGLAAAARD